MKRWCGASRSTKRRYLIPSPSVEPSAPMADRGAWETTQLTVSELITDILTWNYSEDDVD